MDIKNVLKKLDKYLYIPIFLILLTIVLIGFSIWTILSILVWVAFYLLFVKKLYTINQLTSLPLNIVLIVVIFLNLIFLAGGRILSNKTPTAEKTLTADECKPIYDSYNKKILDVSGEGLRGTVGIEINPQDCKAEVYYNFMIEIELQKNYTMGEGFSYEYKYVGGLVKADNSRNYVKGSGQIFEVFRNKEVLPDPFDFGTQNMDYGHSGEYPDSSTSTFYHGWMSNYTFKTLSLEEIKEFNKYIVVDGSKYMQKKAEEEGYSYSLDTTTAAREGDLLKTLEITYIER